MASFRRVSFTTSMREVNEQLCEKHAHRLPIYNASLDLFELLSKCHNCPIAWFLALESVAWQMEILGDCPYTTVNVGDIHMRNVYWQDGLRGINLERDRLRTHQPFSSWVKRSIDLFMKNLLFLVSESSPFAEALAPIPSTEGFPYGHW